jgi:hypothetical protein
MVYIFFLISENMWTRVLGTFTWFSDVAKKATWGEQTQVFFTQQVKFITPYLQSFTEEIPCSASPSDRRS